MVVDDGDNLLPQILQVGIIKRIDHRQSFAQDMVTDLHHDPLGEIVRISAFDQSMAEKIAVRMEMNGIERHFFEQFGQLLLIVCLMSETFLQFAATDEVKGCIRNLVPVLFAHRLHPVNDIRPLEGRPCGSYGSQPRTSSSVV